MRIEVTISALAGLCIGATATFAGPPPPDGSKPLSTILAQVEQMPDFRYIDETELKDGLYKVEYYTKDGVEHKIYIDPQTGKPR
jgi:hypothetical protein